MLCVQDATHFDGLNLGLGWAVDFSRIPFCFFLFVCVRVVEDKWRTLATFLCFFLFSKKVGSIPRTFFSFLWGRWVGDPIQDILVEFGYMLKRTLKKSSDFCHVLATHRTCYQNMAIFFSLKIWQLCRIFSKKTLCKISTNIFLFSSGKLSH